MMKMMRAFGTRAEEETSFVITLEGYTMVRILGEASRVYHQHGNSDTFPLIAVSLKRWENSVKKLLKEADKFLGPHPFHHTCLDNFHASYTNQ